MTFSSSLAHIEDCFYEKRVETSLRGYNDLHDRWISELDCLDRCLKYKPQRCRSFERWRSIRHDLCVRANVSLTDQPSSTELNLFVDYYEIDCRKDTKAVRLQTTTCPGDQLYLIVALNGIDPNYIFLGDSSCKPLWSNETHAQFTTHIDNCSLILTDGSIVGKLRWEGVDKDTNEARQYERFFLCPSDIYQIRLAHWTSTTPGIPTKPVTNLMNVLSVSSPRHRLSSPLYNDEQIIPATYRISLQWILRNRTYSCPESCSISLYSLIHVKFDDLTSFSSGFLLDSCDLKALYPYSNYLQPRRLIYRGCSMDPTVINIPSEINSFSFYLYNILKEPIPFQIQCKLLNNEQKFNQTNCSLITLNDNDQLSIIKNEKRDYSYTLFRSSPVQVVRQIPLNKSAQGQIHSSNSVAPIAAVHHIECSLLAFFFLIYWTF